MVVITTTAISITTVRTTAVAVCVQSTRAAVAVSSAAAAAAVFPRDGCVTSSTTVATTVMKRDAVSAAISSVQLPPSCFIISHVPGWLQISQGKYNYKYKNII